MVLVKRFISVPLVLCKWGSYLTYILSQYVYVQLLVKSITVTLYFVPILITISIITFLHRRMAKWVAKELIQANKIFPLLTGVGKNRYHFCSIWCFCQWWKQNLNSFIPFIWLSLCIFHAQNAFFYFPQNAVSWVRSIQA